MLSKKSNIILTIIGLILLIAGFILRVNSPKELHSSMVALGISLAGVGLAELFYKKVESKNPDLEYKNKVEFEDERNTMIRNKAKARAGDIVQWMIIGIAYITMLMGTSLWITLGIVLVFLSYNFIGLYLMDRYQKKM